MQSHASECILTDSTAFMGDVTLRSRVAQHRFWVQVMTFEGDSAGEALIAALLQCPAPDRRLCIDSYSLVVVNDTFVFSPSARRSPAMQAEIRQRDHLLETARANGIAVHFVNPVGPFLLRYPFRNHKKMVLVDDTAWIGGVNFSEHNFAWHDMMIRLDSAEVARELAHDFTQNWAGIRTERAVEITDGSLYFLDRKVLRHASPTTIKPGHRAMYNALFGELHQAKHEILVFSPYVSWPLLPQLRHIHTTDQARVRVVSPQQNNKALFRAGLQRAARRGDFELTLVPGTMSHLKAILIDRKTLLFGSSNYDFASYLFEEEIVVVSRATELIHEFIQKIALPYISDS